MKVYWNVTVGGSLLKEDRFMLLFCTSPWAQFEAWISLKRKKSTVYFWHCVLLSEFEKKTHQQEHLRLTVCFRCYETVCLWQKVGLFSLICSNNVKND